MAQMVQLTILGTPKSIFPSSQIWAVPVSSFIAVPSTANAGQHSQINVFPAGLNQPVVKLFCAETPAQIAAAANAALV